MKRDLPPTEHPDLAFWTARMKRARNEAIAMATLFTLNKSHDEASYWIKRLASLDLIVFRNADKPCIDGYQPLFFAACGYSTDDLALMGTT